MTGVSEAAEAGVLAVILEVVHAETGVDFSNYRPAMVRRRVLNRMISAGVREFDEYLGLLRTREGEIAGLLARLTIKVSRFYRYGLAFDQLRGVIPELSGRRAPRPIRILSAGCGQGEEAYTLAMLLVAAGAEGFVDAVDVDPEALAAAERGEYRCDVLDELPPAWTEAFMEVLDEASDEPRYRVRSSLRRLVRFRRADLLHPSAAWHDHAYDLVCCRNVVIYLRPEVQPQIFSSARASLAEGGYLLLGEAEWPTPAVEHSLTTVSHRARLFRAPERQT